MEKKTLVGTTSSGVLKELRDADDVVIIGHGRPGYIELRVDEDNGKIKRVDGIRIRDIRRVRKGRKFRKVKVYACNGQDGSSGDTDWRTVSDHGTAYRGKLCYVPRVISGDDGPNFRW
jgi:hypothetical protein